MKYVANLSNLKNCHPEVERMIRGYGNNIDARSLKNLVMLMKSVKSVVKEMLLKEIQNKQKFPHADRRFLSPLSQEEWDHLSSLGELPWCGVHMCMFTCLRSYGEIRTTLKVLLLPVLRWALLLIVVCSRLGVLSHTLPGILLPLPPILPKGITRLQTIPSFSEDSGDFNLGSYAYIASTLSTEPFPHPVSYLLSIIPFGIFWLSYCFFIFFLYYIFFFNAEGYGSIQQVTTSVQQADLPGE